MLTIKPPHLPHGAIKLSNKDFTCTLNHFPWTYLGVALDNLPLREGDNHQQEGSLLLEVDSRQWEGIHQLEGTLVQLEGTLARLEDIRLEDILGLEEDNPNKKDQNQIIIMSKMISKYSGICSPKGHQNLVIFIRGGCIKGFFKITERTLLYSLGKKKVVVLMRWL